MKRLIFFLYTLILSLWIGGIAIFTFVVTPAIFSSYNRDMAGEIVGKLFPGYFTYTLVFSALALVVFFLLKADRSKKPFRLSLALLTIALLANAYVSFKLHPDSAITAGGAFERVLIQRQEKSRGCTGLVLR
jgi:hypothetical protein